MSQPWVKSALPPLAGPLPAWVILPIPFQLFQTTSLFMWAITLSTLVLAVFLKTKGRTLLWVARRVRTRLRGGRVDARGLGYRRAASTDVSIDEFDFDHWRAH